MVFEWGINRFGWRKMGTLCGFDTRVSGICNLLFALLSFTLEDILRAVETHESLIAAPADQLPSPREQQPEQQQQQKQPPAFTLLHINNVEDNDPSVISPSQKIYVPY